MGFFSSVGYAVQGIIETFKRERNFRIMVICLPLVVLLGLFLSVTRWEWIALCFCSGGVLALELLNTAIENTVNLITTERHPLAKRVKDVAAAAVLTWSIFSAIIGGIVFLPYLIDLIG